MRSRRWTRAERLWWRLWRQRLVRKLHQWILTICRLRLYVDIDDFLLFVFILIGLLFLFFPIVFMVLRYKNDFLLLLTRLGHMKMRWCENSLFLCCWIPTRLMESCWWVVWAQESGDYSFSTSRIRAYPICLLLGLYKVTPCRRSRTWMVRDLAHRCM